LIFPRGAEGGNLDGRACKALESLNSDVIPLLKTFNSQQLLFHMNQTTREAIERHIQNILNEFNFQNRKNKYPNACPCYKGKICHNISPEKLNCFLCYCPEYKSEEIEGGCKINSQKGKWFLSDKLPKGKIWDCSDCDYPHREETVKIYLKKMFFS
jgi:Zn-finger protein